MGWNKNGKDVRKAPEETFVRIFGMMKPRRSLYSSSHGEGELDNSVNLCAQVENILWEVEAKKGWAIELVHRLQNR